MSYMTTIAWKNRRHTLSRSGISRMTGLSVTFLIAMIKEAKELGIEGEDALMQYAVEQEPGTRPVERVCNPTGSNNSDGCRRSKEEKAFLKYRALSDSFLFRRPVHTGG